MGTKEELEKRGVKSSALAERPLNYIGATATVTFDEMATRMRNLFVGDETAVARIGDAYDSAFYQKTSGSKQRTYEKVYAGFDWTKATEDETTLQILEEAYGNNDNAPSSQDVNPDDLRKIYGSTKSTPNTRTPRELAVGATDAQNNMRQQRDSTTKGIRGVADVDAPIDPYA